MSHPSSATTQSDPRVAAGYRADIGRIIKYAPAELIGREDEFKLLDAAWSGDPSPLTIHGSPFAFRSRPHIVTFVALGGEGKTSLIAKWTVDEMLAKGWPGCDAAFAWSFYSQGTRDQVAASSDLFLKEAITFFGDDADKEFAASPAGAFEKGQRLARIVGQRRSLLILDGLEPLQYAPTSPTPGQLKDQGIAALLKGLAQNSHGLCVVTTRYSVPDLKAFWQTTAPEVKLLRLSREAGVHLLKTLGVRKESGTAQEFETLVEDVKGHALTLTLLGTYLRDAHSGDIRKRDLVKFEEADAEEQGGHAFRVMAAYEKWLESSLGLQPEGAPAGPMSAESDRARVPVSAPGGLKPPTTFTTAQRALALLRLMGLFDRPAAADCLDALLKAPAIPGLTEPLLGLTEAQRNLALTRLESAKLLTVNRDASGALVSLDAHPHIREYFAARLKDEDRSTENAPLSTLNPQLSTFKEAHRRLYEHLCATTQEGDQPTLEDLQPLYQAVAHGCQAGLQQEVCDVAYFRRVRRGNEHYAPNKLGAWGSELGAIACFFETPWNRVSPALAQADQPWVLNEAANTLRALGRLTEALEPIRAGLDLFIKQTNWKNAAANASNLSELELTLGAVAGAVGDAEQSVTYADRSGDAFQRMSTRATHADALHQAGRRAEAETRFREAEQMQAERQPAYPLLYSLAGFRYCDLLLAAPEREAWQRLLECGGRDARGRPGIGDTAFAGGTMVGKSGDSVTSGASAKAVSATPPGVSATALQNCRAVSQRAAQTLKWAERAAQDILSIALDHLTLGRAALYEAILSHSDLRVPMSELDSAVAGLRRAGQQDDIPRALLTRAWLRFLNGARTGPESAQEDLDEAWEIAERGPMKLFLADIHLHRARLFGTRNSERGARKEETPYPWDQHPDGSPRGPKDDLAAAEKLIHDCGYHRRDEELADANRAILS